MEKKFASRLQCDNIDDSPIQKGKSIARYAY